MNPELLHSTTVGPRETVYMQKRSNNPQRERMANDIWALSNGDKTTFPHSCPNIHLSIIVVLIPLLMPQPRLSESSPSVSQLVRPEVIGIQWMKQLWRVRLVCHFVVRVEVDVFPAVKITIQVFRRSESDGWDCELGVHLPSSALFLVGRVRGDIKVDWFFNRRP